MEIELCPEHQLPFKLVPAGVSKTTGRPYAAFWTCPERGCKLKPTRSAPAYRATPKAEKEPNWDKIAVGKTASLLAAARLQAGIEVRIVRQELNEIFDLAKALCADRDDDLPF